MEFPLMHFLWILCPLETGLPPKLFSHTANSKWLSKVASRLTWDHSKPNLFLNIEYLLIGLII